MVIPMEVSLRVGITPFLPCLCALTSAWYRMLDLWQSPFSGHLNLILLLGFAHRNSLFNLLHLINGVLETSPFMLPGYSKMSPINTDDVDVTAPHLSVTSSTSSHVSLRRSNYGLRVILRHSEDSKQPFNNWEMLQIFSYLT